MFEKIMKVLGFPFCFGFGFTISRGFRLINQGNSDGFQFLLVCALFLSAMVIYIKRMLQRDF